MAQPLREFIQFIWRMQHERRLMDQSAWS